MTAAFAPAAPAAPVAGGTGRLALAFQETLTAIARLRADRHPVPDAAAFRAQMRQLLGRADADARAAGYDPTTCASPGFAVVALLDESALNARQPALAEWARRPLQEELFGNHMAGEWFYQHVQQLLRAPDSGALADLLEVHQLCLLLGFRGRYGTHDPGAVHAVSASVDGRIARLRGESGELAPAWRPPNDAVAGRDPWVRRLAVACALAAVFAAGLWSAGALTLAGSRAELAALAAER
jgi:type VI secretion system protein ImpK